MHKGHLKPLWCYIKATRSETQNLFSKIYVYSTEFAVSEKSICQRVRCILLSPHTMYHGVKSLTTKVNIGFRKKKKKYQDSDTTTRLWLIKSRRPCLHLGARQNGLFKAELLTAKKLPETAQWQNTQNGHTHAHTHTHSPLGEEQSSPQCWGLRLHGPARGPGSISGSNCRGTRSIKNNSLKQ